MAFLIFVFGLLISLWMTLRISYRNILAKVRNSVPQKISELRTNFTSVPEEREDFESPKRGKSDTLQQKKVEELEKKIAELQKQKAEKSSPNKTSLPPGKSLIEKFSAITKRVPIEDSQGKIIESREKNLTLDF